MLVKIPILTCLIFSTLYPLCLWINVQNPIKSPFHKFHLRTTNVVSGIAVIVLMCMDIPLSTKYVVLGWKITLLLTSKHYWKDTYPNMFILSIPSVLGIFSFYVVQTEFISSSLIMLILSVLAGTILCLSIFTMNLGHWYLNVHGLPVTHLMRAVYVFWFFLGLRALYDLIALFAGKIPYQGDLVSIYNFIGTMDGFLLITALFFGTLFPLFTLYFVKGTLNVKSTQSATGILYVILIGVLIGDISYKYYLLKFGVIL